MIALDQVDDKYQINKHLTKNQEIRFLFYENKAIVLLLGDEYKLGQFKVRLDKSSIDGIGLFANQFIPKRSKLMDVFGELLSYDEIKNSSLCMEWNAPKGSPLLLYRKIYTPYYFINHCNENNVITEYTDKSIKVKTILDILEGQEITNTLK